MRVPVLLQFLSDFVHGIISIATGKFEWISTNAGVAEKLLAIFEIGLTADSLQTRLL